jgi:hypothetical protein
MSQSHCWTTEFWHARWTPSENKHAQTHTHTLLTRRTRPRGQHTHERARNRPRRPESPAASRKREAGYQRGTRCTATQRTVAGTGTPATGSFPMWERNDGPGIAIAPAEIRIRHTITHHTDTHCINTEKGKRTQAHRCAHTHTHTHTHTHACARAPTQLSPAKTTVHRALMTYLHWQARTEHACVKRR